LISKESYYQLVYTYTDSKEKFLKNLGDYKSKDKSSEQILIMYRGR
jgi:hypothetical protein